MDRHAGFAAAVELEQGMLQEVLRVLYNAGQLGPYIPLNVGRLSGAVFIEVPSLTFQRANADRVLLTIHGWGALAVALPGRAPETRQSTFQADLLAAATARVATSNVNFGLDSTNATLRSHEITPTSGVFTPEAQAYLASPEFHDALERALRGLLALLSLLFPPINIGFLGAIANAASTSVSVRVLDGVLAMGLDLTAGPVITHGDRGQLVEFAEGMDIAMWTNPVAVPVAYAQVEQGVRTTVDAQGASLDSFSMTVEEGGIRIAGHASKDGNGVQFSLKAVPKLIRPGRHEEWDEEYGEHFTIDTPAREELWFDTQDVQVDVERAWWVVLLDVLGAFLAGIGTLVVESIVEMVRSNIVGGVHAAGGATIAARTQQFSLPNVTRPLMQIRIERFECHGEGIFTGILFRPLFWSGSIVGPSWVSAEELVRAPARYRIDLPPDALAADPALRIAWTVRNVGTNAIVFTLDDVAANAIGIQLYADALLGGDGFRIDCRVYRVLGSRVTEVFATVVGLHVADRLDRSHPYVRWSHTAITPTVRVEADGTRTMLGYEPHLRHSDIHRTALPGRCLMATRYSARATPEYLDALPFPRAELDANRAQVCDYCFYGGPTKTVPLIP